MDIPLEISFDNMDQSDAIEMQARDKINKLAEKFDFIGGARISIEIPHKHHNKGNVPRIRIEFSLRTGDPMVISDEPHRPFEKFHDPDLYTIMNDVFDTAERKLRRYKERNLTDYRRR